MLKKYKEQQTTLTLILIVLAIICGLLYPHIFAHLQFITTLFLNLIKMVIVPVMLSCLIVTIADLKREKLGKTIFTSFTYIISSEIIAVTIAIISFRFISLPVSESMKTLLKHTDTTSMHQLGQQHWQIRCSVILSKMKGIKNLVCDTQQYY